MLSLDASELAFARQLIPLKALEADYLQHLLSRAQVLDLAPGASVFRRGDTQQLCYYLLAGAVELRFASGFRELIRPAPGAPALLPELPRPCDAVARDATRLLAIELDDLDRLLSWSEITRYLVRHLAAHQPQEELDFTSLVLNSNLFHKVPPVNAERILPRLTRVTAAAGEAVVRQGDPGDCCYFIYQGTAVVTRDGVTVARIGAGRCFGEDALVAGAPRNATVTLLEDSVLMRLAREDFELLLLEPQVDEYSEDGSVSLSATPVFVDVRTEAEYRAGHLLLAINIPLSELETAARQMDLSAPYVFYCDTGRRSRAAAVLMQKRGLPAYALKEGLVGSGMQYQLIDSPGFILEQGAVVARA